MCTLSKPEELPQIKISIEAYGEKYTLEFSGELVMDDFVQVLKKICYLVGFQPETIKEYILDEE